MLGASKHAAKADGAATGSRERPRAEPTAGSNGAWSRLATRAGPLQAKLAVNAPGDRHEQEADRVADQVMRMPDPEAVAPGGATPQIQRMCSACEEEEHKVQRELPKEDEEKKLQAKEAPGAVPEVGPETESRIGAMQGGGAPLSPDLRGYFEPRLGQDLSAVRLHTGGEAQTAASDVQARAFTVGSDIAFGKGQFRPETDDGKHLLAHELVHTVQQGASTEVRRKYSLADLRGAATKKDGSLKGIRPATTFYPGSPGNTADRRAMVLAGIHGDEKSAIALGREAKSEIDSGSLVPDFHTLFIPRANPTKGRGTSSVKDLNREFGGTTASPEPIAGEIQSMVTEFDPERILSIHSIFRHPLAGLFLDPVRATGSAPVPTGTEAERRTGFTGDARNRAGMRLTEEMLAAMRADPAGAAVTTGNDPGRKTVGSGKRTTELDFPASDYPGGAGASPHSLIYPQTQQIGSGSSGGGRTSLGEWASQLPSGPSVITLEVPGDAIATGGANWRPFLPAVRQFLRIPGAAAPGAAPAAPAKSAPATTAAPRSVAPKRADKISRAPPKSNPLSDKDLSEKDGIPPAFLKNVYRRQVAIWTKGGATYLHEVPSADRVSLPKSDVLRPVSIHKDVASSVTGLLAAARKDLAAAGGAGAAAGVDELRIRSGYRSAPEQFQIWEDNVKKYYRDTKVERQKLPDEHGDDAAQLMAEYINKRVFSPGYSPHQHAKTIDVTYKSKTDWPDPKARDPSWAPADTGAPAIATWKASWFFDWLSKNAGTYDFVQNPSLDEPWHWEFQPKKAGAKSSSSIFDLLRRVLDIILKIFKILLGLSPGDEKADADPEKPPEEAPKEPPAQAPHPPGAPSPVELP